MKNRIKKLKLPLSKMTGNEKDYTAVLLEDVNSNMKAFWEVLSGTQNDVKELKTEMADLKDAVADNSIEITGLKTETKKITARLDSIEGKQDDLIKEVSSIKAEIKSLKTSISILTKEDKEKFETLELRIIRIEKHLELAA